MIRKSSLCNRPLKKYLDAIFNEEVKKMAVKKIKRAYALKKEFPIECDASDVTLSKALELYASVVMTEKFIIEANKFIMDHATSYQIMKPWAKELHEYWQLVQRQIELAEQLIRAVIQQREKESEPCQEKNTISESESTTVP